MSDSIEVPLQYICMVVSDAAYQEEGSRQIVELIAEKNLPANCRVYKKNRTEFLGEGVWQLAVVYYEVPT